ncbi:MAG: hypothetical protein Q8Q33_04960, partial [Chlamydiota bacterium]|nr:hypothetical protein [Chlamydiota bacterium]
MFKNKILPILLLLIPLAYCPIFFNPYEIKYLVVDILLATGVIFALWTLRTEKLCLRFDIIKLLFFLICVYITLHYILSPAKDIIRIEMFQWIGGALIFFAGRWLWRTQKSLSLFFHANTAAIIVMACWTIIEWHFKGIKPNAGAGNPNFLAGYFLLSAPILIGSIWSIRRSKFYAIFVVLVSVLMGFAFSLTRSWSAVVSLIILFALCIAIFVQKPKHRIVCWLLFGILLVGIISSDIVMASFANQVRYDIRPFLWS